MFDRGGVQFRSMASMVAMALAYALLGWFSLQLATINHVVSNIWPASGLAVAMIWHSSHRGTLGMILGGMLLGWVSQHSLPACLLITTGSTLSAWLVVYFLRLLAPEQPLRSLRGCSVFIVLVVILPLIAASTGILALTQLDTMPADGWKSAWLTWWVGDTTGMLVVAPMLMDWFDAHDQINELLQLRWLLFATASLMSAGVAFLDWINLSLGSSLAFITLPILVTAALSIPLFQSMLLLVLMAMMAVLGIISGLDTAASPLLNAGLLQIIIYISTSALTVLMLYAAASERRDLENQMRRTSERLRASLRQLEETAEEREIAMLRLMESEKMATLGSLVAGMAHELNTPLGNSITLASGIQHTAGVLESYVAGEQVSRTNLQGQLHDLREAARLLERSSRHAGDMISNFKQIAVDQSSNRRRRFYLPELCRDIGATLLPQFKTSPHQLIIQIDDEIWMDSYPGALEQVVMNLIHNALLHAFDGHQEGRILLKVRHKPGDEVARISVEDNGCGISPEHQKQIFKPFFTTRSGTGGSGLGLYVVQQLITDVLGGKLTLVSGVNTGSRFSIELPLQAPMSQPTPKSTAENSG
ncbi:MAG: hypothetical protein HKM02_07250 [Pseudomonadales bacterium]|nr:hypothetical protein [Pseudomonadales bacterium]